MHIAEADHDAIKHADRDTAHEAGHEEHQAIEPRGDDLLHCLAAQSLGRVLRGLAPLPAPRFFASSAGPRAGSLPRPLPTADTFGFRRLRGHSLAMLGRSARLRVNFMPSDATEAPAVVAKRLCY
jgi:hypothetical protein